MVVTWMQRRRRCKTNYRDWERLPVKSLYINLIAHGSSSPLQTPWQSRNARASAFWKRFIWTSSWPPVCRPYRSCWTCSIHQGRRGYANSVMHFDDKSTTFSKSVSLITITRLDMERTESLCTFFARSICSAWMEVLWTPRLMKRVSLQCETTSPVLPIAADVHPEIEQSPSPVIFGFGLFSEPFKRLPCLCSLVLIRCHSLISTNNCKMPMSK